MQSRRQWTDERRDKSAALFSRDQGPWKQGSLISISRCRLYSATPVRTMGQTEWWLCSKTNRCRIRAARLSFVSSHYWNWPKRCFVSRGSKSEKRITPSGCPAAFPFDNTAAKACALKLLNNETNSLVAHEFDAISRTKGALSYPHGCFVCAPCVQRKRNILHLSLIGTRWSSAHTSRHSTMIGNRAGHVFLPKLRCAIVIAFFEAWFGPKWLLRSAWPAGCPVNRQGFWVAIWHKYYVTFVAPFNWEVTVRQLSPAECLRIGAFSVYAKSHWKEAFYSSIFV